MSNVIRACIICFKENILAFSQSWLAKTNVHSLFTIYIIWPNMLQMPLQRASFCLKGYRRLWQLYAIMKTHVKSSCSWGGKGGGRKGGLRGAQRPIWSLKKDGRDSMGDLKFNVHSTFVIIYIIVDYTQLLITLRFVFLKKMNGRLLDWWHLGIGLILLVVIYYTD